jgi:hypothetical protein
MLKIELIAVHQGAEIVMMEIFSVHAAIYVFINLTFLPFRFNLIQHF